jgi:hypothetical protein
MWSFASNQQIEDRGGGWHALTQKFCARFNPFRAIRFGRLPPCARTAFKLIAA